MEKLREELLALIAEKISIIQKDTGDYGGNAVEALVDRLEAARAPQKIHRLVVLGERVSDGTITLAEVRELLR